MLLEALPIANIYIIDSFMSIIFRHNDARVFALYTFSFLGKHSSSKLNCSSYENKTPIIFLALVVENYMTTYIQAGFKT